MTEPRIPPAYVRGHASIERQLVAAARSLSWPILAGTCAVAFMAIARLASAIGFAYPQSALLVGIVGVAWFADHVSGLRARW